MGLWAQAGKPDFARCAEFISRFDPDLRESLSRSEMKGLQWVLYFAWQGGARSAQAGSYCSFSQGALGAKLRRSRWTVARALVGLFKKGLITSLFRRPSSDGTWQTKLYFLSDKLKAILARILGKSNRTLPSAKVPHKNAEHTLKAGALPLTVRAASQDKDNPNENDTGNERMGAWLKRFQATHGFSLGTA